MGAGAVLAAALAGGTAATLWRGRRRAAAAEAAYPATGAFVTVGRQRVHYVQAGHGPDLVLIHGASGSVRDFGFGMMQALSAHWRVTAFDRPGLGWSDPLPGGETALAAQVAVLRGAAAALGLRDPLLAGQSYGGAVALAWALEAPPPALVLIAAPALPWPGSLDPWYRLNSHPALRRLIVPLASAWVPQAHVDRVIGSIFTPDPVPEGYVETIGAALSVRPATLAANVAQVNDLRPQLVAMAPRYAGLRLPVEIVHGDADTIVPLAVHSQPLAGLLPQAALSVLAGAGHMPHHSRLPQVLAAIDRAAGRAGLL